MWCSQLKSDFRVCDVAVAMTKAGLHAARTFQCSGGGIWAWEWGIDGQARPYAVQRAAALGGCVVDNAGGARVGEARAAGPNGGCSSSAAVSLNSNASPMGRPR